jgi:hypothetical protein
MFITICKDGSLSELTDALLQEDVLAPGHPLKMPPFVRYSIIYPDTQKCNFVFERMHVRKITGCHKEERHFRHVRLNRMNLVFA